MHENEAQRQIKQHFTRVQVIAGDVLCTCDHHCVPDVHMTYLSLFTSLLSRYL